MVLEQLNAVLTKNLISLVILQKKLTCFVIVSDKSFGSLYLAIHKNQLFSLLYQ